MGKDVLWALMLGALKILVNVFEARVEGLPGWMHKLGTRRSVPGLHEVALGHLAFTGPTLHSCLNAPPSASQVFATGGPVKCRAASAKRTIMLGESLAKSYST